ncbi:MAG: hypothetical protein ACD_61C00286G0005 [uncultured bacterium]|nr:MAG: hypothetical protein ACD_61C00286G0005 [uncultured bacterium]
MQLTPEQQELSDQQVARVKERAANSPKPVVKEEEVVPVEGDGRLLWNGKPVQSGALEGSFRNDTAQIPSGVPTELTRGRSPISPENAAADLQYDRDKGKWFRVVGGKKVYE